MHIIPYLIWIKLLYLFGIIQSQSTWLREEKLPVKLAGKPIDRWLEQMYS